MQTLVTALLCGVLLGGAASARAQSIDSLDQLTPEIAPGHEVYVQTRDKTTITGKLWELSAGAIRLRGKNGSVQTVPADRVAAVVKVDGNENGMLIGAAIGAIPAVAMGALLGMQCANEGGACLGPIVGVGGLFIGVGTAIGYAVDGASDNGRRFTLARIAVGTDTEVTVSPVAGLRSAGVRLTW